MIVRGAAGISWRKSIRSGGEGGACVEVAWVGDAVGVRDSKDRAGAVLRFAPAAWTGFLAGFRADPGTDLAQLP
nr:DUF397 domain-containing protein [Micromonospora sp. DSM 115978]